jgi:hypothetical protein
VGAKAHAQAIATAAAKAATAAENYAIAAKDAVGATAKKVATEVEDLAVAARNKSIALAVARYDKTVQGAKYLAAGAVVTTEEAAIASVKLLGFEVSVARSAASLAYNLSPAAQLASAAYKALKQKFSPLKPALIPSMPCPASDDAAARAARIKKRNDLIAKAYGSPDAKQLQQDMYAVEMARLSDDAYEYYDPTRPRTGPPAPWKVMTDEELAAKGIDPDLLKKSYAVMYQAPDDFPFKPKAVLAFRGTVPADPSDILNNYKQAMGMEADQYTAATELGKQVGKSMRDTQVTGHSLGGGKAQAAGVQGDMNGIMFNSAGLNPKTVGMTDDQLEGHSDQFLQARTEGGLAQAGGDPLTGVESLPAWQQNVLAQAVKGTADVARSAAGVDSWARQQLGLQPLVNNIPAKYQPMVKELSDNLKTAQTQLDENQALSRGKWLRPPPIGKKATPVIAKNADDGTNASVASQHSLSTMIVGYESRKLATVSALLKETNTKDNPESYIGPTKTVMR